MLKRIVRLKRFWLKWEPAVLIVGATAGFLIWAYSNFATANEVNATKTELRAYVDQRHGEVNQQLRDIKNSQAAQRVVLDQILLRVSH